jgi:hypothetical protein
VAYDPVEDDPRYLEVLDEVEQETKTRMKKDGWPDKPTFLGWCHLYWGYKKRVLWEKHGISWRSPAEMNPGLLYD